jgi:hypothetical protein
VITHSELTVEYDGTGGRVTTIPEVMSMDGVMKMSLPGFDAPVGTSNIRVTYRNLVTGTAMTRDVAMNVAPRPALEKPE